MEGRLDSSDILMKIRNFNSLCSCRVACRIVLRSVGLLIVAFSGSTLVLSLHAQNGPASGQSANLGHVAVQASEAKTIAANNTGAQSQLTNSPGATIEQVHLSGKDQQAQVRVDGTGQLMYKAFRLNQPDRLVLDFSGAIVRVQERSLSSSFYPVRLVRIGQFKANVARVVIETEEQLPYTIAESKNAVTVVFNPGTVPEPRVTTKKEIFTSAAAVPPELVPSAAPQTAENDQEAKSLLGSSMQSAMARPSHLGAEPSAPAAEERQTVQAQTQQATSGSVPQVGEKNAPQSLAVVHSAAQQPAVTATQTVSGYVLGPDDEIMIRGIEAPEISDKPDKPVLIGTNGDITLPLIGRVKTGGLTVEQLEAELNTRFKQFIQEPQISVTVTEFRSQPVSVFGAVTKPGVVQLRGRQTLYEVLSMAGGPRDTAGSILTVTRPRQSGEIPLAGARVDTTGQFSSVELNVREILEGMNPAANIEIKPYDIISVSEGSSNMIYVVGDVQHAGAFTLGGQRKVSVLRAVSLAGGLGRTAKSDKARIVHEVAGELKLREIPVNIHQILSGKAKDIELGPDDVLVVPTSSRKVFTTDFLPSAFSAAVGGAIYRY
jgi:polysaccharide export outer membrane protein